MPTSRQPADGADRAWNTLAYGLGQVLAGLADLDFFTLAVDDKIVVSVSRDAADVWILASGPDDEVEPVELSPRQQAGLAQAGFAAPLGSATERSTQRSNWWLRLPAGELEAGDRGGYVIVSVLRDVYGCSHPKAVIWQGLAMSDGSRSALSALPLGNPV